MKHIDRRDLIASLASAAFLATEPAYASVCDVKRSRNSGLSTKSYQCDLGGGRRLKTTFMRVSDVLFDSAGRASLPGVFGVYQDLVNDHTLIDNPTLKTFTFLLENYSFAFEPSGVFLNFDGRAEGHRLKEETTNIKTNARWRTLGVWDEPQPDDLPLFPLPSVLRKAMRGQGKRSESFLRYATEDDFSSLDQKLDRYLRLWGSNPNGKVGLSDMGNLKLLRHIRAGAAPDFLPLIYQSYFGFEGCTGGASGGAHYLPPALYVDLAVCRNTGSRPIQIDDFFGAAEQRDGLRSYSPRTPESSRQFGWQPVRLDPGKSVLMVQRLLFGVLPYNLTDSSTRIVAKRAVFGHTYLPKGVLVDGQPAPFDGRSHNAVIAGSFYEKGSCPYLLSWCEASQEWVHLGKILTDCIGRKNSGEEVRRFEGLRTRFKIVEREHEQSVLTSIGLTVELRDGSNVQLQHEMQRVVLNIGEAYEVCFTLPGGLEPADVSGCELRVKGFYERYNERDFAERRKLVREYA